MRDTVQRYDGPTFDLVEMLVRGWWQHVGATRLSAVPKLMVAEARNFPDVARFYIDEVVRPGREAIAAMVRRGVERGEFRPVDPYVAGQLLIAPLFMVALWRNSLAMCTSDRIDPLPFLEAHIEMLRQGLAAQPRS